MAHHTIQNWGLKSWPNDWGTPPEMVRYYLLGEVDGHAVEPEIVRRTGEIFECKDGNTYQLGEVHPGYDDAMGGRAREKMLSSFKPLSEQVLHSVSNQVAKAGISLIAGWITYQLM